MNHDEILDKINAFIAKCVPKDRQSLTYDIGIVNGEIMNVRVNRVYIPIEEIIPEIVP